MSREERDEYTSVCQALAQWENAFPGKSAVILKFEIHQAAKERREIQLLLDGAMHQWRVRSESEERARETAIKAIERL